MSVQNYAKKEQLAKLLSDFNGLDNPNYHEELLEIIRFLNESEDFLEAFGQNALTFLWKLHDLTKIIKDQNE